MFSYLRPHRRTPSTPTSPLPSPLPDQSHSWESSLHQPSNENYHVSRTQDVNIPQQRPQNASASPASLAPVTKVASSDHDQLMGYRYEDTIQEEGSRPPAWLAQGDRRQRPGSAGDSGKVRPSGAQYMRPQTSNNTNQAFRGRPGGDIYPFITAADLQESTVNTGRRPAGARMPTFPLVTPQATVPTLELAQPRTGKTRLNLLNPMSLLARRRNPQAATYPLPTPIPLHISEPKSSGGYDPRIRGTKVHDFSAPRPKRNTSYNDAPGLQGASTENGRNQRSANGQHDDSSLRAPEERNINRWSGGNHTPVFTEDFDEEQYPAAGPHVRKANDITDLPLPRPPYARGASQSSLKALATAGNGFEAEQIAGANEGSKPRKSLTPTQPPMLLNVGSDTLSQMFTSPVDINDNAVESAQHPPRSSSSKKILSRNLSQASVKEANMFGLPRHMQSTSSRFSFDMIGAASQEKLLEDRHRQKAMEKKTSSPEPRNSYENEGEDDYDYDNMYDDDGLEERIPGVNADAEGEEEGFINDSQGLGGFTFHSLGASISNSPLSPYSPGIVSTPRDADGEVIGFALSKESPALQMRQTSQSVTTPDSPADTNSLNSRQNRSSTGSRGLGLFSTSHSQEQDLSRNLDASRDTTSNLGRSLKPMINDDDLYFDDGIIDPPSNGEDAPEFDESVFDNEDTDEYGRPLRPLSLPTLYSPPLVKPDTISVNQNSNRTEGKNRTSQEILDMESPISPMSQHALAPHSSVSEKSKGIDQTLQQGHSLTHDTLSAYQSALAAAAYTAAANGRFRRDSSPALYFDERDEQPDMTTDNSRMSDLSTHQPLSVNYNDDFDYDDALEDDSIIAEANAEALANDSDGFYGQEFGFFSVPAAGEAQFGGYFGSRGPNGLVPNQNGRVVSREPNLTPITERSEYSNRNSIMSLPLSAVSHGMGPGSLNSPGLAQLAGMMSEYDDNDMSLNALLKLRRGAWGGSQASLRSSNGSPMSAVGEETSPAQQSPLVQTSFLSHTRQISGLSIGSDFNPSDAGSAPESPTLTMSMPTRPAPVPAAAAPFNSSLPAPPPALVSSLQSRPMSPTMKFSAAVGMVTSNDAENVSALVRQKPTHRHTASSDSISYMKEDDPVVGERWVLERRRTAETGEVEILGREIISGGMI